MSKILLPDGVYLGHADDGERTGVSVILAPKGMTGGVSVRGCAPGTRETDLLRPEKTIDKVYAVALCGGSAFGLSACDGVMRYCREKNIGHDVGGVKVPLVAAAVIFDLNDGIFAYPDAETGYCACLGAKNHDLLFGSVGAGTGAVLGKILGKAFSQKSGIGYATVKAGEAFVTAITVVNALGDVIDYKTGKIVAGAARDGQFINTNGLILSGALSGYMKEGSNTTLSCVITNVKLNKLECSKLASICHDAYAKSISPVHTDYDGDTVFALSAGEIPLDFTLVSVMAVEAVCGSIVSAVTEK